MRFSQLALATMTLAATLSASAGVYVGGQLGWGDVRQKGYTNAIINASLLQITPFATLVSTNTTSNRQTGLAGQIFVGYQFNINWAAEFGFTQFSNAVSRVSAVGQDSALQLPINMTGRSSIRTNAFDMVVKGIVPLPDHISAYGKLGLAYLRADEQFSSTLSELTTINTTLHMSESRVYPTYAVGLAYNFTNKISSDISWIRIQKIGGGSLPSTDFAALGLLYCFG
jgi:opacity protein-like surface antigen